jgi:hypothetical protein
LQGWRGEAALVSNETAHSQLNSLSSLRFDPAYPVILSKKSLVGINRNERLFETLRTGRIIGKTCAIPLLRKQPVFSEAWRVHHGTL